MLDVEAAVLLDVKDAVLLDVKDRVRNGELVFDDVVLYDGVIEDVGVLLVGHCLSPALNCRIVVLEFALLG